MIKYFKKLFCKHNSKKYLSREKFTNVSILRGSSISQIGEVDLLECDNCGKICKENKTVHKTEIRLFGEPKTTTYTFHNKL